MIAQGTTRKLTQPAGSYAGDQPAGPDAPTIDIQSPLPQEFTAQTAAPHSASVQASDPASGGEASPAPAAPVIQPPSQLPDGSGGAVAVPPPQLAPAGVLPAPAGSVIQDTFGNGTPPAAAPAAGADPTGATSSFGPDSNLINTQINATNDPRTLNLQGMQDASLSKILNGPDRNKMALDQYDTWDAETNPNFQHSITDATDAAATHGQIRSGQLTNRYGDLAQQRVLDQTTARNKYMQNALDASIGDTQRGFEDVSGAANTAYNQGAAGRGEQRTERGYQSSQAQQALYDRIQQYLAEQGAQNTNFGQASDLYNMGNSGDPYGAYEAASGQAAGEAQGSMSDVGALLQALARRRATSGAAA